MSAPQYNSPDIPLRYGDASIDCNGTGGIMRGVTLTIDGAITVHAHLSPENARALAAELVKCADTADLRVAA